jgi:TM2 domain-containing membrane protein YozV
MRFALTIATALVLLPAHLGAQAATARAVAAIARDTTVAPPKGQHPPTIVGRKDPATATLLGVVLPGAGQMYAGRTGKGLALLGLSVGAVVTGAQLSSGTACTVTVPNPGSNVYVTNCTDGKRGPLHAGVGVAVASWLYGAITAAGDARDANAVETRHASATPVIERTYGRTGLGLAYRF